MSLLKKILVGALVLVVAVGLFLVWVLRGDTAQYPLADTTGPKPKLAEPAPQTFPTLGLAKPIGWKAGEAPVAAQGLTVSRFADGLDHPRSVVVLPNGDVLVAETNGPKSDGPGGITGLVMGYLMNAVGAGEASPNKIVLLRDANGDGKAEQRFVIANPALDSPFGMVLREGRLYVANHNAVVSWPYQLGQTTLSGTPEKLMDLPGGGNHWVRNLALSPDGNRLYVTVGSSSNIAENGIDKEKGRAAIHEYDFTRKSAREYASGLRNPNGLDFNPRTGELWTVVNERDMLGSDLVPDYLTNVPLGVTYGWPWAYWKKNIDWRVQEPMPEYTLEYVRKPEYALGAHTAPLGLAFARGGNVMGSRFASGAFIARHGSWNRKPLSGYDVVFVRFDDRGNVLPNQPVPVLTGFLDKDGKAHGRPTWVAFAKDGALLVSDDTGGVIWRVTAPGAAPAAAIAEIPSTPLPAKPKGTGKFIARPDENSDLTKPQP
ncbi:sorbosone dehydrogenase family protein [Novosphingobium sp. KCTC 2891]|uniref:PQQ-dependent sugar dehydrogenase n=1 Tax=Novosphingobium sp. KCTC 2891 TaxID=2989730 RepID=UPI002223857F|nr:sorbosone dehydrogenase family protein [Novosphingobium sp. KCTC 2891]MCW1382244.1 sorbosone dehydrogenase family protein [Novosphingobium sp. KCTC 2891]